LRDGDRHFFDAAGGVPVTVKIHRASGVMDINLAGVHQ
jgi:hypothetical protein